MKIYDKELSTIHENNKKITLVSLTVPKFFELLSISFIGTVNTALLSDYSQDAVSAVSIACSLLNYFVTFINILIIGGSFVQGYELGRSSRKTAEQVVGTSILSTLVFSALIGIVLSVFSRPLLHFMNAKGIVLEYAVTYFKVCMYVLPISLLQQLMTAFLICNGCSVEAFLVQLINNILNYLLCRVALTHGLSVLPGGVLGVSIARAAAQTIALIAATSFYLLRKCPFSLRFSFSAFKRIIKLGLPGGMQNTSYHFSQALTTAMIVSLGTASVNAKVYAANILSYISIFSYAVGNSAGTLTSRFKGRGELDRIKAFCVQNLRITVILNLLLSVFAFLLRRQLLTVFTSDTEILRLAEPIMLADIAVEIARAFNHIYEPMLSAGGDTKSPFIVSFLTCWLFGVLLAYLLGIRCALGILGCWIAFAVNEASKAITYAAIWRKGKWQSKKI